jgi:transketolase
LAFNSLTLNTQEQRSLLEKSWKIKKRFLEMYQRANAGHIGCSLSCAEILTYLRFGWMEDQDELILSKGHAAAALYSTWAEYGIISEEEILTFYKNGTYLAAHPPAGKIKGIPFATGSLGHGLSIAAGLGMAAKLKKSDKKIFCVTSDGELNEGSIWEAALFIAHHNLQNTFWLIDRNNLQGFGRTEDIMKMNPLDDKLKAFGFEVAEADGHDFLSIDKARQQHKGTKPLAIICHTVKGNAVEYFQDTVGCHYLPMKNDQFQLANDDIDAFYQTKLKSVQ